MKYIILAALLGATTACAMLQQDQLCAEPEKHVRENRDNVHLFCQLMDAIVANDRQQAELLLQQAHYVSNVLKVRHRQAKAMCKRETSSSNSKESVQDCMGDFHHANAYYRYYLGPKHLAEYAVNVTIRNCDKSTCLPLFNSIKRILNNPFATINYYDLAQNSNALEALYQMNVPLDTQRLCTEIAHQHSAKSVATAPIVHCYQPEFIPFMLTMTKEKIAEMCEPSPQQAEQEHNMRLPVSGRLLHGSAAFCKELKLFYSKLKDM